MVSEQIPVYKIKENLESGCYGYLLCPWCDFLTCLSLFSGSVKMQYLVLPPKTKIYRFFTSELLHVCNVENRISNGCML